jgi:endonuclease YncB( thermonuclease family)
VPHRYVGKRLDVRLGQKLVAIFDRGGLFNERIGRDGFATLATFPPDMRCIERIRAAQQEASEAGRGLWSEDAWVAPPPAPSQPTPPAAPPAQMPWYTSSHSSVQHYYYERDPQ